MGEWRGSWKGEQQHPPFRYKDAVVRGAKTWRPPHPPGSGHSSVPQWEKKFCATVGAIPWKRLCEIQRFMPVYKNVVEWDDSAALEAFHNAKARFRAQYHGLTCNIPMPDPDMYIDEVDPDAVVDPELVADLDKPLPVLAERDTAATNGWDSFVMNEPVPSGWGDAEDPSPTNDNQAEHCSANRIIYTEKPIQTTGWGETVESQPSGWHIQDDAGNAWKGNGGGWETVQDYSKWDGGDNYWDNDRSVGNMNQPTGWVTIETQASGWDVKDVSGNAWNGYGGGCGEGVVQDSLWRDRRDNYWDHERSVGMNQPTGWGKTVETQDSGWDVKDVSGNAWNGHGGGWGEGVVQDNSWRDRRDNYWDSGRNNTSGAWENRQNEQGRRSGRKRDGGGRFGSRFTKPRYQMDGYQSNNGWRTGRGRNRTNDPYEKGVYDKQHLAMQQ